MDPPVDPPTEQTGRIDAALEAQLRALLSSDPLQDAPQDDQPGGGERDRRSPDSPGGRLRGAPAGGARTGTPAGGARTGAPAGGAPAGDSRRPLMPADARTGAPVGGPTPRAAGPTPRAGGPPPRAGGPTPRVVGGPRQPSARRRFMKTRSPQPIMLGLAGVAIIVTVTIALSNRAASISYMRAQAGWSDGGAAVKLEGNQLQVLVVGMARPQPGHGYQVWVMDRSSKKLVPTSAWLKPAASGAGGVEVPGNYHDWDAAAVYVEPLHGPDTTRSGAVVVADLRGKA